MIKTTNKTKRIIKKCIDRNLECNCCLLRKKLEKLYENELITHLNIGKMTKIKQLNKLTTVL